MAGLTLAVALAGIDARATYGARVTADEPQYLLTASSLAEDADLDISDELAAERFRDFHQADLNPQTIELNRSGQRLSPHDPLLPLLLAGPVRSGGWLGAKLVLSLLLAATAATTAWVAVRRFAISTGTAAVTTAALFTSPPLIGYGAQIYPEVPAALAVTVGVAAVTGPRSNRTLTIAVVAVLALPWLSVKYVPVAAVLAAAVVAAAWTDDSARTGGRRPMALTVGSLVLSGLAYLLFHQRVYGGWTVYAAGDHFVDGEFLVVGRDPDYPGRSRRLIGLVVDRGWGLAAWAPAYLGLIPALAAAAVAAVRTRDRGWTLVVALVAAGWAVATWVALTMHGWWWPGRQVVVVLPVAVIAIAHCIDGRPRLRRLLVTVSALAVVNWLWLVAEASSGRRTLIVDFTETGSPLYRLWAPLLPDHRSPALWDWVLTGFWVAGLGTLSVLAARAVRTESPTWPPADGAESRRFVATATADQAPR